jgi:hypothetical protein
MIDDKKYIRIGHFDNFKGENSILISTDIHGLLELEDIFLKLSNGLHYFDFSTLQHLDNKFRINLKAFINKDNIGLIQESTDNYVWRLNSQKWGEFREKLTTIYRLGKDGHHFLDSDSTENKDLQVIFSWNEYDLKFWKQNKDIYG